MDLTTFDTNWPNDYMTLTIAWLCVAVCVVCCAVILHKAVFDSSKLRWACLVMGILVASLSVCNALRIQSVMPEYTYNILRSLNILLYLNLMVFITLDIGGKFYSPNGRINRLYHISMATTVVISVLILSIIIIEALPDYFDLGNSINNVARIIWPIAVIFAYLYAFYPVIMTRSVMEEPSNVVAVGVW